MYQRTVPFGEAITRAFSNYCNFGGRASRSEYWFFILFNFIVTLLIASIFGDSDSGAIITGIYSLGVLLPSLGLTIRRLHDVGKGGGWIFISLIPFVGAIWFIILVAGPSESGDNRFGPMPNLIQ